VFKEQGKSIIFITHKLREALEICDEITVLREGKAIGDVNPSEIDESQLTEMMVGKEIILGTKGEESKEEKKVVLEIDHIEALDDLGLSSLNGVSLEVKSHEILGIAGIQGNGQTELVETLTGLRKPIAGEIRLNGHDIAGLSPRDIIKAGVAHIPERKSRGLIFDFTIEENVILGIHREKPFAQNSLIQNRRAITAHAKQLMAQFGIRTPDTKTVVSELSGGNQQRVVIARELSKNPKIIVVFQPTVGLDVAGIEYVHEQLIKMKNSGGAVLLVSMDLDEIIMLSDRIAVMYDGSIVAVKESATTTKAELGLLMLGG